MTHPEITVPDDLIPADVELVGIDGNAGSVIGHVVRGLKEAGNSRAVIDSFRTQAISGDYDHLLVVAMTFCENNGIGPDN